MTCAWVAAIVVYPRFGLAGLVFTDLKLRKSEQTPNPVFSKGVGFQALFQRFSDIHLRLLEPTKGSPYTTKRNKENIFVTEVVYRSSIYSRTIYQLTVLLGMHFGPVPQLDFNPHWFLADPMPPLTRLVAQHIVKSTFSLLNIFYKYCISQSTLMANSNKIHSITNQIVWCYSTNMETCGSYIVMANQQGNTATMRHLLKYVWTQLVHQNWVCLSLSVWILVQSVLFKSVLNFLVHNCIVANWTGKLSILFNALVIW